MTLDAVRSALPDDAALIEFAVYRTFDPRAESNTTAYGAARYVAYVVTRRDTRGVDLGPASVIDAAVASFRQALGDPQRTDVNLLARQVDAAVMQPVRGLAGPARRLLISPDGTLNLIPFEALRDEQGRYLLERFQIGYLSSGRDLLRLQVQRQSRSAAVVVADPLFGDPPVPGDARAMSSAAAGRRSLTSVENLASAYFAPLRGTALEAQRIKALFPEATDSGARAGDHPRGQSARRTAAAAYRDTWLFHPGSAAPDHEPAPAFRACADGRQSQVGAGNGAAARGHPDRARGVEPRSVGDEARDIVRV